MGKFLKKYSKKTSPALSVIPIRVISAGNSQTGKTVFGVRYLTEEEIEELRTIRITRGDEVVTMTKETKDGVKEIPMEVKADRRVIYIGTEKGLDSIKPSEDTPEEDRFFDPEIVSEIEILDDTNFSLVDQSGGFAIMGRKVDHNIAINRFEFVIDGIRRDVLTERIYDIAKTFSHKDHKIMSFEDFIKYYNKREETDYEETDEKIFEEWLKDSNEKIERMKNDLNRAERKFLIALQYKIRGCLVIDNLSNYWEWMQTYRAVDLMGLDPEQLRRVKPDAKHIGKEKGVDEASGNAYDSMTAWNRINSDHSNIIMTIKTLPLDVVFIMKYRSTKDDKGRYKLNGNKNVVYDSDAVLRHSKVVADSSSTSPVFRNGTISCRIEAIRKNSRSGNLVEVGDTFYDRDVHLANIIRIKNNKEPERKVQGVHISDMEFDDLEFDDDVEVTDE